MTKQRKSSYDIKTLKSYFNKELVELGCKPEYVGLCVKQFALNYGSTDTHLGHLQTWITARRYWHQQIIDGKFHVPAQFK